MTTQYQVKLGMDGKLYWRSGGTYAAPVWTEIDNVRDVSNALERGEADVTVRKNGGWRATIGTILDASGEFLMLDIEGDVGFEEVKYAFLNKQPMELAFLNGGITTPGSKGLRAIFSVTAFNEDQSLEEGIAHSVTVKPTIAAYKPIWYAVGLIAAAEPTTGLGANLYWDSSAAKCTFTALGNTFIGVTVADYTTAATLVYYDSGAPRP